MSDELDIVKRQLKTAVDMLVLFCALGYIFWVTGHIAVFIGMMVVGWIANIGLLKFAERGSR